MMLDSDLRLCSGVDVDGLLGGDERRDRGQVRVGDSDDAHVGLDRGERIVGRQGPGLGQGVEQCGFAHVGQADDPRFHGRCPRS